MFDFSLIVNGTIIRFKNNGQHFVCIHHTKCDMRNRKRLNKQIKNQTGFYLFGGLWYDGDILTDAPYGKCIEHLTKGMGNNIEIVGHITENKTVNL